jgi:cell division septation protein DedD
MEAPRNDGQMFQRWAEAVAEIPTSDEEALARDRRNARETLARVDTPVALPLTLTAEQAGLRPAMSIQVVDALDLHDARSLGLRAAMTVADSVVGRDRPATVQPAALSTAPADPDGAWAAQIGAFRSRDDAETQWRKLKAANVSALAGVTPRFEPVDLGAKGRWVRLQAANLPSRAAAAAVCQAAGVTDQWCVRTA